MWEKNSLTFGIIIGIVLPLIGYVLFYGLFEGLEAFGWVSDKGFRPQFRERTTAILAIAMNALALNFYQKKACTETMRGVVIITSLYVVLWLIIFGKNVL
jgi:hypothetical protein